MATYRIAVIAGDGIGKEVIPPGIAAMEAAVRGSDVTLSFTEFPWGCEFYLKRQRMLDEDAFTSNSDTQVPTQQSVKAYVDNANAFLAALAQQKVVVVGTALATTGTVNLDMQALVGTAQTITATGKMDTTFTRVMGYTEINIGSSATIKWGNQRLRVALALDTTGSMASAGKIDALKTATSTLFTSAGTMPARPHTVA